jgi:hypothetical protein
MQVAGSATMTIRATAIYNTQEYANTFIVIV